MQKTLLRRIVKEEIRKRRKGISLSLIAIRKRITLAVAREITQQSPLSERYWNTFVDATEAESDLWAFLQLKDGSEVVLNAQQIQQLLSLYERWRRMCEFLIDEYDRLSPRFKERRWTKSTVLGIARLVASAEAAISSDFAEQGKTILSPEHFSALKGTIDWARFVTLGQDPYLRFLEEMHNALCFVKRHPHFANICEPRGIRASV